MSMTTKIGKVMAYDKGLQTTKLATWFFDQVIMFSHVKIEKNFISHSTSSMNTKLDRDVACDVGLPPMKSYHPSIRRSCEVN